MVAVALEMATAVVGLGEGFGVCDGDGGETKMVVIVMMVVLLVSQMAMEMVVSVVATMLACRRGSVWWREGASERARACVG